MYIHATGSTNVLRNGYNFDNYQARARVVDGPELPVMYFGLCTKADAFSNGQPAGWRGADVKDCLFEYGTKHNAFIASGVMEDCVAWKNEVYATAGNSTMFITFNEAGGLSTIFRRCKAIGSSTVPGGSTVGGTVGFYGHTNAAPYESIIYEDCEITNLYQGYGGTANYIIVKGGSGSRVTTHIMAAAVVAEYIYDTTPTGTTTPYR